MDTLQIIAEPRRRQILSLVWANELSVNEITSNFDITVAAVSQHLAVLRQADMVKMRKDGNRRLYTANHDTLAEFKPILEAMWTTTLGNLAAAIEEDTNA